jgi:hypothetical protein
MSSMVITMTLPMFPFILLIIALGSILIYQKTSHEVTRVLMAGSAIVCLIWGFAIAHWSIHLLSLILLLKLKSPSMILETVKINK